LLAGSKKLNPATVSVNIADGVVVPFYIDDRAAAEHE
jgi:hypothetical protein